jgi:hypothetical protein
MQRTDVDIPSDVLTSRHTELSELLGALQAVRDGDFSVRLPGDWTGLEGKIADTFNEIVASNERMAAELERVGTVVGKARQDTAAREVRPPSRRVGRDGRIGQHADRRPSLADHLR